MDTPLALALARRLYEARPLVVEGKTLPWDAMVAYSALHARAAYQDIDALLIAAIPDRCAINAACDGVRSVLPELSLHEANAVAEAAWRAIIQSAREWLEKRT